MSFPNDIFSRMFTDKNTHLLYPKEDVPAHDIADIVQTNIFNVMLNRRSQRKFENKDVEEWKLEMIFAAADTAPTAGGFQGFEIYHVKNEEIKRKMVEGANNQPYVYAPVVLVFCINPQKIKFSTRHDQKILSTRRNSCSSIFPTCCACFRIEFHMDRHV